MDRLAASGVRFEAAHAHNVTTLPSHANILSGRYPFDHGVRDNSGFRFPPGSRPSPRFSPPAATGRGPSSAPSRSRRGSGCAAVSRSTTTASSGRAPGRPSCWRSGGAPTRWPSRADGSRAQAGRPFLCWVHVFEPHYPYEPPEPFASRFRESPYHGEVAATDAILGPLLEPILAAGQAGRTLVVLTADHGESLGEHGEATHGIFAYEATLRVPLVLYQPRLFRPRVVPDPVRHVDLLPTILDALALPVPDGLPGVSLLPLAVGGLLRSFVDLLRGALRTAQSRVGAPSRDPGRTDQVRRPPGPRAVRPGERPGRGPQPRGDAAPGARGDAGAARPAARGGPRDRAGARERRRPRAAAEPGLRGRRSEPGEGALHRGRRPEAPHASSTVCCSRWRASTWRET